MKVCFTLVRYRDAGMPTYTYFWVTEHQKVFGPYFDTEQEAIDWLNQKPETKDKNDST